MTMGKSLGISFGILLAVFLVFFFGYGQFVMDVGGDIEVDVYKQFFMAMGGVSVAGGWLANLLWFIAGENYDGVANIHFKYWMFFLLSLVVSIGSMIMLFIQGAEGAAVGYALAVFAGPLVYYLSSLFGSADSVKYIPPLA